MPASAAGRAGGGAGHQGAHRGPQGQADRAGGGAQGWMVSLVEFIWFKSDLSRIYNWILDKFAKKSKKKIKTDVKSTELD